MIPGCLEDGLHQHCAGTMELHQVLFAQVLDGFNYLALLPLFDALPLLFKALLLQFVEHRFYISLRCSILACWIKEGMIKQPSNWRPL